MAILPISSINLGSRSSISFKGDKEVYPKDSQYTPPVDGDMEVSPRKSKSRRARYASVPVAVWMILNPALSAQAGEMSTPEPKQITMEMPYSPVESDSEVMYAYAAAPVEATSSSSAAPYGWASLKGENILTAKRGKTSVTGFNMLYTNIESYDGNNTVRYVYIISDDENTAPTNFNAAPPRVKELVYHKTGDGRDFCGVVITGHIVDRNEKINGYMTSEIKIDDDTANELIDLLSGDSRWNNKTKIEFRTTNSPHIATPVIRDSNK